MRAVVQRVSHASVVVDEKTVASIKGGLLILLGVTHDDTQEDIDWLAGKIARLRIFNDPKGVMNVSLADTGQDAIVVSQFTLHASVKKGNRPSYINSAGPDIAVPFYENFIKKLEDLLSKKIGSGVFGADMKVSLLNDGPVTIVIDSKKRE
ncbi:D-aminoacyl-tRNA deacylase [Ascidiimonas aurantiaca]|uniref:D-aminoacyl-tRNA deacylase n=1 Tax=Ascidiimonas aurantiaca TaxID=1685432 RepID=UPI0030ECEE9D